jgi:hypothetical protein
MKQVSIALVGSLLALFAAPGCETASREPAKPKKQGAHVRVFNATDAPLSFILYPKQLNEQNAPGEANPFQKEPPGKRNLQILSPDKQLLQEIPVSLASGTPTTFIVRGGPKAFQVSQIDNEERFAPEGKCLVVLSSGYEGDPVKVTLRVPGREIELGEASKIALGDQVVVASGEYEVLLDGKPIARKELEAGIAYSVVVRAFKGVPVVSVLRNSPPEMKVAGVEGASAAG